MESSSTALRFKKDGSGLKTRSGREASQNAEELRGLIELLQREGVRSYLEIGARHGDTFFDVMHSLPKGSRGIAVDLPGGNWGTIKSGAYLQGACDQLNQEGYQVFCMLADSQLESTAETISRFGPFDAALIDGDHLYSGVKRDWELYHGHSRLVAFHDIAGEGQCQRKSLLPVEVPRLWKEIRNDFPHQEFIAPGSKMGIGVLWVK